MFAWGSARRSEPNFAQLHIRFGAGIALALALFAGASASADPDAPRAITRERACPEIGLTEEQVRALSAEYAASVARDRERTFAVPDVYGHGSVLDVGKVVLKVTNWGSLGNFDGLVSTDPSCQWPGASSVEYLYYAPLVVGAVNPQATNANAIRRTSIFKEFRPATLLPEDRMYPAFDGVVFGSRFVNDDGDFDESAAALIDEDFLDGHDNDGDGRVDEDFGALGQKMFSWVMRDDTPEAINLAQIEQHVPLGLEVRQTAWAYSLSQYENFDVIDTEVRNVSGHELDSLLVGFYVDFDAGSAQRDAAYFNDDLDLPAYPFGNFKYTLPGTDFRRQLPHPPLGPQFPPGVPLCTALDVRVNGFSVADDDGDEDHTPGIPSLLLFDATTDPLGLTAPADVNWRSYRSYPRGTPFPERGGPANDQQRYEALLETGGIDLEGSPETNPRFGFIRQEPGDQRGDYRAWVAVGPYLKVKQGSSVHLTVGIALARGSYREASLYPLDYLRYATGLLSQEALFEKYPSVANAFAAQVAFEGVWERRGGFRTTTGYGRETEVCVPNTGQTQFLSDCRDGDLLRNISPGRCAWFDFDCDYCTGVFDGQTGLGLFHKTWNATPPPPNPNTNVTTGYNYADNPARAWVPAGDGSVTIAWDNLSEITADPGDRHEFDFRGYRVWKVSGWTRPVGSPGPSDEQWALLAEFRRFDYWNAQTRSPIANNRYWKRLSATESTLVCPRILSPASGDSIDLCLERGDLWDPQTGTVLRPDESIPCAGSPNCEFEEACVLGTASVAGCVVERREKYPIGRYRFVDREVHNGFLYFYSVTAFDSTRSESGVTTQLEGRRSAVEAEAVSPQTGTRERGVWVVPNPYRGFGDPRRRPSSWDLTPNASDPTGTHLDFMGLPAGRWTIRIYTVAGDLVAELRSSDAVNESVRSPVSQPGGGALPGYNRQQDTPNDGQARWNLISRNGQDVVSGIYIYSVESEKGAIERGRFVVVR